MVAENRIRWLRIRFARGQQVIEEKPVAIGVVRTVFIEIAGPTGSEIATATVINQVTGQQQHVGVLFGVARISARSSC